MHTLSCSGLFETWCSIPSLLLADIFFTNNGLSRFEEGLLTNHDAISNSISLGKDSKQNMRTIVKPSILLFFVIWIQFQSSRTLTTYQIHSFKSTLFQVAIILAFLNVPIMLFWERLSQLLNKITQTGEVSVTSSISLYRSCSCFWRENSLSCKTTIFKSHYPLSTYKVLR